MIYILSGIAKSGKSIIAKDVLKTHHMYVISTDWIMMMLYYGNKDLTIDIKKSDATVSAFLRPYIEGLITSLADSKMDYLIEGVHVEPAMVEKLMKRFPNKIRAIFLGYQEIDPKVKAQQLKAHINMIDNPWYNHMDEEELNHLTHYLKKESQKLYDACILHHQIYIDVLDIKTEMTNIINTLFQLKKPIFGGENE